MPDVPFRFLPADEVARTIPDPTEALKACRDEPNPETRTRMFAGLATRPDLTSKHLAAIVKHTDRDHHTTLVTLLNNPTLRRSPKVWAAARDLINPDATPTLLHALHDPSEYLPDMLRVADQHSMFKDLHDRLRDAFPAEQITAVLDTFIDGYLIALDDPRTYAQPDTTIPGMTLLSEAQVTRLIETLCDHIDNLPEDTDPYSVEASAYESCLSRLIARTDLTDPQGHRLVDGLIRLAEIGDAHAEKWAEETGRADLGYGYARHITRTLTNGNLPQPARIRALLCPQIVAMLRYDNFARTGFTPDTVLAAVRQGAPLSLLVDYFVLTVTSEDLTAFTTRLRAEGAAATNYGHGVLSALAHAGTDAIGTPGWDDLYALWLEAVPDTNDGCAQDQFANLVDRRTVNWSDRSTRPVLHAFAAWASASDDPLLRRHAVAHIYDESQFIAALNDPDPAVRYEISAHPQVTEAVLGLLAADPDATVRWTVAGHEKATGEILHGLRDDPAQMVRLAVAEHRKTHSETLQAMAHDADAEVRTVVAQRVLDALAAHA